MPGDAAWGKVAPVPPGDRAFGADWLRSRPGVHGRAGPTSAAGRAAGAGPSRTPSPGLQEARALATRHGKADLGFVADLQLAAA